MPHPSPPSDANPMHIIPPCLRRIALIAAALVPAVSLPTTAQTDAWRQFRGPAGQGHAENSALPLRWNEQQNVTWRTPIPGRAWSSPVIEHGVIWLTTALDTPASEEEIKRQQDRRTDRQPILVAARVDFRAIGVDAQTGKILHDHFLFSQKFPQAIHALNSYASPTPIIENGKLYCHFGSYGTCCLDVASGKLDWASRDVQVKHENGPGSTPVLWHDLLITHFDGIDVQEVVAFDKHSGKIVWRTRRSGELRENPQFRKAYATPLIVPVAGRELLISPAADWVYAYEPATGKEIWKVAYGDLGFSNVPRPVAGHGLLYVCTSFGRSKVLAIDLAATPPKIAWECKRQAPRMPSPILVGEELYFISDSGIATCLAAKTGKPHWVKRLGGNYSASPLFSNGRIYFLSREGIVTVIQAGPKYKKLAENRLDGKLMASPAVLGDTLFLRTDRALYRIERPATRKKAAP